jgi:tight adherence protein C
MPAFVIALGATAAFGVLLVAWSFASRPDRVQSRLADISTGRVRSLEEIELQKPLLERTLKPIVARVSVGAQRFATGSFEERTETRLILAGRPMHLAASEWVALKLLSTVVLGFVVAGIFLLLGQSTFSVLLFGVVGAGIGYIAPEFALRSAIGQRQERIVEQLPDVLDLLTISVRAGVGFDAAVERVIGSIEGPLSDEFRTALGEIRVGKTRREALKGIVDRTDVRPLSNFINAMIQADKLGVPIANVLQIQSEQLRIERRQRAEEMASKAPIKMLFPLVGCIFPSLFIIILGPALILLAGQH